MLPERELDSEPEPEPESDSSEARAGRDWVGVRELRRDLATRVRRAAAGHRVVVTVGGRPAAALVPIATDSAPTLQALVASGLVVPPRRLGQASEHAAPVPIWSGVRLDRALRELRG